MKTITMLEFRQNAPAILRGLKRSGEILITYRGKPAAKLSPPDEAEESIDLSNDPFYQLAAMAVEGDETDAKMTNEMIDDILYGPNRPCGP